MDFIKIKNYFFKAFLDLTFAKNKVNLYTKSYNGFKYHSFNLFLQN